MKQRTFGKLRRTMRTVTIRMDRSELLDNHDPFFVQRALALAGAPGTENGTISSGTIDVDDTDDPNFVLVTWKATEGGDED